MVCCASPEPEARGPEPGARGKRPSAQGPRAYQDALPPPASPAMLRAGEGTHFTPPRLPAPNRAMMRKLPPASMRMLCPSGHISELQNSASRWSLETAQLDLPVESKAK
ncbi:hypothetical protein NDU88_002016 [Pleurodeles waltl]|uniref:Uncharacterized protein n=1 Tax=Pleurodeles waltl TaxID=8319 RepID=A0AAV7LEX1_PLEWA|nr:hypothetical protein NDU88_002016 [Pleurodeles waltl]